MRQLKAHLILAGALLASASGAVADDTIVVNDIETQETAFWNDYRHRVLDGDPNLEATLGEWVRSMNPIVSASDLAALIETQRDAIGSIAARWTTEVHSGADENMTDARTSVSFESAESMLRRDMTFHAGRRDTTNAELATYDGHVVRVAATRSGRKGAGQIQHFQGRPQFIDSSDPLAQAMLVDSARDLGMQWMPYDLVEYLRFEATYVLEDTVMVNGSECVVAVLGVPARFRVYLDIDRDFAVVRFDEYDYIYHDDAPAERCLVHLREVHGHHDLGNGMWLPKRTVTARLAGDRDPQVPQGTRMWHRITDVHEAAVNIDIDSERFAAIFDDGQMINDVITQVTYREGETPSIDETIATTIPLDETAERSPVQTAQWLPARDLAASSCAVTVLAIAFLFMRGRRHG